MSKKYALLFIIIFLSSFNLVYADVVINEVQVLPTGNKFFELKNTSGSGVDLTGWYVKKKTASGTESTLVVASRLEGKSISANGYFLIANETGYTGSGTLGAGWPPSNTGVASNNTLILYDNNNVEIDKVGWGSAIDCESPCPANPPEGQSIQRTSSGSWITAAPTPGEENETSDSSDDADDEDEGNDEEDENTDEEGADEEDNSTTSSSSSGSSGSSKKAKTPAKPLSKMKAEIKVKTISHVGVPITFQGTAFGVRGEQMFRGKYFWNFGDGDFREIKVVGPDKFTHTYFYPGEYTVLFEYYPDHFAETPDAASRITIRVVEPAISISSAGNENNFFVELANDTDYDADISGWILSAGGQIFTFPKNTFINSKKKMTVSGNLTRFSLEGKGALKLTNPQGKVVFDYNAPAVEPPAETAVAEVEENKIIEKKSKYENKEVKNLKNETPTEAPLPQIPIENLSASAVESEEAENSSGNSYLPMAASVIFIGASAGAVYFIRRGRRNILPGQDFKILDE